MSGAHAEYQTCHGEPVAARLDYLKITHFLRLLHGPEDRITAKILRDSLKNKRAGFVAEALAIAEKYGLFPIPHNLSTLREDAQLLVINPKKIIYKWHFDKDMAALKSSTQAKLFSALFPSNTSYFEYKPLDIMTRIVGTRSSRAARTLFLQLLAGSCPLITSVGFPNVACHFCNQPNCTTTHLFFECPKFGAARAQFFSDIQKILFDHNQMHLYRHLKNCLENNLFPKALPILLGCNHINPQNQLSRKFRNKKNHPSDFIPIQTLKFIEKNLVVGDSPLNEP